MLVAAGCGDSTEQSGASGTEFPTRAINIIIPLDAGSAPDGTFRKLASIVEEEIGQDIVIVNMPGGSSIVGTTAALTAEPDGYTVGMSADVVVALLPKLQETSWEGPADVTPLVQVVDAAMALFVHADSDIHTIDDLVTEAESNPGQVTIGTAGERGDLTYMQALLLAKETGVELPPVPMGAGKQVLGVLNGSAVAGIAQPLIVQEHVQAGDLRILGIFGEKVPPGVDAELASDQGYDVTNVPASEILIAPPDLPDDIRDRLAEIFGDAVQSQEFQDFAAEGTLLASYLGPQDLSAELAEADETFTTLVEEFGW